MNRYIDSFTKVVAANLAVLYTQPSQAADRHRQDEQHPNVVFILVDDMGWRDLGCFGSDFYETPNIDSMAERGMRFSSAYASCHVSSPSRASILTGMYPASLGLTDWLPGRREYAHQRLSTTNVAQDLPAEAETIAETLRNNGYRTALIGKWHLGEAGSKPQEHGFDIHIPDGYLKGWPNTYYAPFRMNGYDGNEGDYLTDCMTEEAVRYIRSNAGSPFFLLLSHFAVHDPIEGRKDLVEKYTEKLKSMDYGDVAPYILEGNPDDPEALSREETKKLLSDSLYASHRILPHNLVKIKQLQDNVNFAAMVESVDESVGRIVSTLDSLGIAENTVLIFYSDNGGMSAANYGNPNRFIPSDQLDKAYSTAVYPLRGGKGWMYEGGLRVPMLIEWPGHIKNGGVCDFPVTGADFYRTIISLTGSKAPKEAGRDGVDLSRAIYGKKMKDRPLFWHFPHYSNHGMASPAGAVRYGDYKLIEYFVNGTVQLYDVKNDPQEMCDLSEQMPEKVAELREMLSDWRESVGAQMPTENLSYDPVIAAERYIKVIPPKFMPCHVSDRQTGVRGSEFSLLPDDGIWALEQRYEATWERENLEMAQDLFEKQAADCKEIIRKLSSSDASSGEISALLETAIGAEALYQATGFESYGQFASDARKAVQSSLGAVHGDDSLIYRWNLLNAMMFEMNGNGRLLSSLIRPVNQSSKYAPAFDTMLFGRCAGDLFNNLLIVPYDSFAFAPGIKFGGGKIEVKKTASAIDVCLKEYTVPHTYAKYSIEVFVKDKASISEVLLNGKKVQWRYNNRGFVTVSSLWQEGDRLTIFL